MSIAEPTTKIAGPIPRIVRPGRPVKGTNGHNGRLGNDNGHGLELRAKEFIEEAGMVVPAN